MSTNSSNGRIALITSLGSAGILIGGISIASQQWIGVGVGVLLLAAAAFLGRKLPVTE
jgi:hypothetical protein